MKTSITYKWFTAFAAVALLGFVGAGVSEAFECAGESAFGPSGCAVTSTDVAVSGDNLVEVGAGATSVANGEITFTMDLNSELGCEIGDFNVAIFSDYTALLDVLNGGGQYSVGKSADGQSVGTGSHAEVTVPIPTESGDISICVAHASSTCGSVTVGTTPINGTTDRQWFTYFECKTGCPIAVDCLADQLDGTTGVTDINVTGENLSTTDPIDPIAVLAARVDCDGFDANGNVFNAFSATVQVTGSGFTLLFPFGNFLPDNPVIEAFAASFVGVPVSSSFPGFIAMQLGNADEDLECQLSCALAEEVFGFTSTPDGTVLFQPFPDSNIVTASDCFNVTGTGGGGSS